MTRNEAALREYNATRSREAAKAKRAHAHDALCRLSIHRPPSAELGMVAHYRVVLRARITHPEMSLADLAAEHGTTKDIYAALLRRALAYADRTVEEQAKVVV